MIMLVGETFTKLSIFVREIARTQSLRFALGSFLISFQNRTFFPEHLGQLLLRFAVQKCECPAPYTEAHMEPWFPELEGRSFLDVGASLGRYSRYMATRCSRIHAFEPNPASCGILRHKTRRYGNVEIHRVALGEQDGEGFLFLHENPAHDSLMFRKHDYKGRRIRVPIRRLDSYDFETPVGLIKIDTEGYDVRTLRGAEETIREHRPRVIVEIHPPYAENKEAVSRILRALGYVLVMIRNPNPRIRIWGHIVADPINKQNQSVLSRRRSALPSSEGERRPNYG